MSTSHYETDFYSWIEYQSNFLRKKEFDKLDLDNLIEEIESLGRSEKRTLKSYIATLLMHMLKIKFQPEKRTRSWDNSIKDSKYEASKCLQENPSLKHKLNEIVQDAYHSARLRASNETGLEEKIFPEECPWDVESILEERK